MLSTLLAVEICARIMKIHWWSIFERQSHIFFCRPPRCHQCEASLIPLSHDYKCTVHIFRAVRNELFLRVCVFAQSECRWFYDAIFQVLLHTIPHNQLQSMRECIRFFRSNACFNFKVSTGFSHFSTAFGRFPGTKKYKREKFQSLKNKHRKELPKKTTRFPEFLRFSAIYSRALNFICSEYGGMDAWMQKKIDSNWSNSSSSGEFFYALV